MIAFDVVGTPRPTPRMKAAKKGAHASVYTPRGPIDDWKSMVYLAALEHRPRAPLVGPLTVDLGFRFPRPRAHYVANDPARDLKASAPYWHTTGSGSNGGDRDNLDKAVLDTLGDAGYWASSDGQVCTGSVSKRYALPGETPGVTIYIDGLSNVVPAERRARMEHATI